MTPSAWADRPVRVAVVAEYYPRRRDPVLGVWAHRQAVAARGAGAEVAALVLERPIPPADAARQVVRGRVRPLGRAIRAITAQPRHDTLDGIDVEYVRFLAPPRARSYASWGRWAARPLAAALARLADSGRLDLIHAHYAAPAGVAALDFAGPRGIPLVVSVHGGDVLGRELAGPVGRAAVGRVLAESDAVLCNSRATLTRAAALAGSDRKMRVVHLGADAPAAGSPRHDEPTIATLGHVIERKRHSDVLRALRLVRDSIPEVRWTVIGDGPALPGLRAMAQDLGLVDRVRFTGQLPPPRAADELARCHLMVMPSVDEAFGVAYVEALACGVPAIGSRGEGGPEEIAAAGGGMVLVPPADVEELAAAIVGCLSDAERLRRLSAAARTTAAAHFSWEACGRATVAAYRDALESGPARAGGTAAGGPATGSRPAPAGRAL